MGAFTGGGSFDWDVAKCGCMVVVMNCRVRRDLQCQNHHLQTCPIASSLTSISIVSWAELSTMEIDLHCRAMHAHTSI